MNTNWTKKFKPKNTLNFFVSQNEAEKSETTSYDNLSEVVRSSPVGQYVLTKQVSISTTFYKQFLSYKSFWPSFSLHTVCLCNFWRKNISTKVVRNMMNTYRRQFYQHLLKSFCTSWFTLFLFVYGIGRWFKWF